MPERQPLTAAVPTDLPAPARGVRSLATGPRARAAIAGTALGAALVVAAPAAPSEATSSSLGAGHTLSAGQYLLSPDGLNQLIMQSDGNLVEYSSGSPIWCTNTNGVASGGHLSMEASGVATVYTAGGSVAWRSSGSGTGSTNRLSVQDDGNVVVYTSASHAVYSATARATTLFPGGRLRSGQSLASMNEEFRATMGSDGNFVLSRRGTTTWSSGTSGKASGGYVAMGTDGTLAVYSSSGAKVWSTGALGAGTMLVVQDDANLVAYAPKSNRAPWSSHTYDGLAMTPQGYAKQYMLANYHWGADKFPSLDNLWMRESGWRWDAKNPSSGAYGIPQSLPADKMAVNGADYLTSFKTQIRWGTGYIHDRYSTPIQAWAHSQKYGWYGVEPTQR